MRLRFLFMMLLITIAALATSAQQEPAMTRSALKPFENIAPVKLSVRHITDTTIPKRALINNKYIKDWYYEGIPVDSGSLGKVYRMPVDNMLCLVPDATTTARMPVKKIKAPEQMPNAFSRRDMNKSGKK